MIDEGLADVFRHAGGVVLVRDVPHLASRLQRLHRAGRLVRPLPGVYIIPDLAGDRRVLAIAAGRWAPGLTVCGMAAAALTYWPQAPIETIDLAGAVRRRVPTGMRFLHHEVPGGFRVQRSGAWVTTPAMTAAYLAAADRGNAIDHALRSGAATLDGIRQALDALRGCPGNVTRSRVVARSRSRPWSFAERVLHDGLDRHGILGWAANVPVVVAGRRYVLDVLFERERLVLEVDGFATHTTPAAFENDRTRQNALVSAGYRVLRFTYRMLMDDLDGVIAIIRRELGGPGRLPATRVAQRSCD